MNKTKLVLLGLLTAVGCNIEIDTPSETADEFVARFNGELGELTREVQAAFWVRYTYINVDTALLGQATIRGVAKPIGSRLPEVRGPGNIGGVGEDAQASEVRHRAMPPNAVNSLR